jgi:hypothetical protein
MRNWIKFLSTKKWFLPLVLFVPFTGIISPYWYVLVFLVYFFVGAWYFMLEE